MMKILIIFFILSACTEEKQTPVRKPMTPEEIKANVKAQKLAERKVLERNDPRYILDLEYAEASYSNDLDLLIVFDGEGGDWYSAYLDPTLSFMADVPEDYIATPQDIDSMFGRASYYQAESNAFYFSTIREVSNVIYTLDPEKQIDKKLYTCPKNEREKLLYAGSISPLERIYYHPEFKRTYIKKLTLFTPTYYIILNGEDPAITNDVTNKLTSPIYPMIIRKKAENNTYYYSLFFTNEQGVFHEPYKFQGSVSLFLEKDSTITNGE